MTISSGTLSSCATLLAGLVATLVIVTNVTSHKSDEMVQFFVSEDVMYYLSGYTADAQLAKERCERDGLKLLTITTEVENENVKEHLKKLGWVEIDGVWTSGTKLRNNSLVWSTSDEPLAFSDFEKLQRIGRKRISRNRRNTVTVKECNCANTSCTDGKPSPPCVNAPNCNVTLGACKTITHDCDVECPTCTSFRPNCSSTCPPCVVESPVCEAIQGPCTVTSGVCSTSSPQCNITTPPCVTQRPNCTTIQKPCKPASTVSHCSSVPKCRINTGDLCVTEAPPCVTTQSPCVTTQSPCYEVTTPAPPCQPTPPKCHLVFDPPNCNRKRDVNCRKIRKCDQGSWHCPPSPNTTTTVCPEPSTTCGPPTTVCPPPRTTCRPPIDCTPVICQSPPIICQDPETHCPPAQTTCPPPQIICSPPETTCPDPVVDCPEPEIRCSKPFVRCPGPEVSCPGVITSCTDAKPVCPPPTVVCPEPTISCDKPETCPGYSFGPTIPDKTCEDCPCANDPTTPMPNPDTEEIDGSGCVGLQRRYGYKWDVQECKTHQHFICEGHKDLGWEDW